MAGLTGRQKAAILLITLGPELAGRIYAKLDDDEIDRLTLEIAGLSRVPTDARRAVLQEFHDLSVAHGLNLQGGLGYAESLLEAALGPEKASEIMRRLTQSLQTKPFAFLRRAQPDQILGFIQNEHPQTIALILTYLTEDQAAAVLPGLPPDVQVDVISRMAQLDRASPEIVREIERVLERKLVNVVADDLLQTGGIESAAQILNRVGRQTERTILERLAEDQPDLAEEIKKRMFLFEDLVQLDDRSLQRLLREIDLTKDLPLALKGASQEVTEKIMRNISSRAAEDLKENLELLGPVRLRDIEMAQQKIVSLVRQLEESGEIIISRGGGDDIVV
jgi:flagellar motor switch protein FliG